MSKPAPNCFVCGDRPATTTITVARRPVAGSPALPLTWDVCDACAAKVRPMPVQETRQRATRRAVSGDGRAKE